MSIIRWARCGAAGLGAVGLLAAAAWAADPPPKPMPPLKAEDAPRPRRTAPELPPPPPSLLDPNAAPIDLATAFKLAGVQNAQLLLARQQVEEAVAQHQLAAAQILPTFNNGFSGDAHTGTLQRANGAIIKVNRESFYTGLGASAVGAGTVNIPGLVWEGNVSEGIYARLITKQVVHEREFASTAVRNSVLLDVAEAYVALLQAEGHAAIAVQARDDSREVARITANFAATGQGRQADADRAATDLEQREADIVEAESEELAASARLCQLLDLDPSLRLAATDGWVVPAPIVPDPIPLPQLLAIALTQRPELGERRAAVREALLALNAAKVLPFSPNVIIGFSAGTFGGGSNLAAEGAAGVPPQPRFGNFADRTDFDAVVYWTARNLGVGNLAMMRLAQSNLHTNNLREVEMLDRVRTEVATAYVRTHARYAQIETSERAVRTGAQAFQEDLVRARNLQAHPIEVLDSLRLLRTSRDDYLDAISDYNRAQFELYVALGQPPAGSLARPVPADLVPPPPPPTRPLPAPK